MRSMISAARWTMSPTAIGTAKIRRPKSTHGARRSRRFIAARPDRARRPLAGHLSQFAMEKEDFLAVIDGMEMDLHGPIVAPDLATLDLYCDRVASAVGRLSTPIFGMAREPGRRLAHHLGRALQLTNILRDLDDDAAIGRLYLPRENLEKAGIDDHDADRCDRASGARPRLRGSHRNCEKPLCDRRKTSWTRHPAPP